MSDVFISYSRKDIAFARVLYEALKAKGLDIWIDWEDIPPVAQWLGEVYGAIEAANTFVFIVSQTSIRSENCQKEIAHAVQHGKRLAPIVLHEVDPGELPAPIAELNWIFFREQDDSQQSFDTLHEAIQTDLDWVRAHTRLLVRAVEWDNRQRDPSVLLRGKDLEEAERWLTQGAAKEPKPTPLHGEYVLAGRRAETRRQRTTLGAVALGLVVAIVLALVAWGQRNAAVDAKSTAVAEAEVRATAEAVAVAEANMRATAEVEAVTEAHVRATAEVNAVAEANARATAQAEAETRRQEAEEQRQIAVARLLTAQSQVVLDSTDTGLVRSVLLAVESMRRVPSIEGDQALRGGVNLLPRPVAQMEGVSMIAPAFSPDGQWVVAGGEDNTVRVWEVPSGQEVARLDFGPVLVTAFSPDGRRVAAASSLGTAQIWDMPSGREVARLDHGGEVWDVVFSPDGQRLATASKDGTARVWEAASGQELARMVHQGGVNAIAFSPDGMWVVSGSDDGTAQVWDATTGKAEAQIDLAPLAVRAVAVSPDGRQVALGCGTSIQVWDVVKGGAVWEVSTYVPFGSQPIRPERSVAFSPDGRRLVWGSDDHTVRVLEAASWTQVARMVHGDRVGAVAFSPDGRWVASRSDDGTTRVWEASTGREVTRIVEARAQAVAFSPNGRWVASGGLWEAGTGAETAWMRHANPVTGVAFSPDGRWVATAEGCFGFLPCAATVRVWEAAGGAEVARVTHDGPVRAMAFSPDGTWVASGSFDTTARVCEASTGTEVARMAHDESVNAVVISPDGRWVASAGREVRVWEAATGREVARVAHEKPVLALAFSPDGRWVASGSYDGAVRVWEAATGKEVARMGHQELPGGEPVVALAFSPDGRWLASGALDRTMRVWEAASGERVAVMGLVEAVRAVAFSQDGRWLAANSGTVQVWEAGTNQLVWQAATGKAIVEMPAETRSMGILAFSPDGNWLVTGSRDGTARVWEAGTGREVARMVHEEPVSAVAFGPDGRSVASGSEDGMVRVWLWQPEDLIADACGRLPRNLTQEEWQQYAGAEPCRPTCPNLPDLCAPSTPNED